MGVLQSSVHLLRVLLLFFSMILFVNDISHWDLWKYLISFSSLYLTLFHFSVIVMTIIFEVIIAFLFLVMYDILLFMFVNFRYLTKSLFITWSNLPHMIIFN